MREIRYHIFDPTGNITVLVESPVPVEAQPAVAAALLRAEPAAEQAGFLSAAEGCGLALRMAGGEFCGNAAMSAAAFYALRNGVTAGPIRVRVSGAPAPVAVRLESLDDCSVPPHMGGNGTVSAGGWRGTVEMPRPLSVGRENLPGGASPVVVRLPGIAHVILTQTVSREEAESAVRDWCAALGADALGLMLLGADHEELGLTPLVYVPAGDTLYWERSCASGSAAVGAYLAAEAGKPVTAALREPGGTLTVSAAPDGAVSLTGTVKYLKEGAIEL